MSWTNSLNLSFGLELGIVVQRVKKSNVLMLNNIAGGEGIPCVRKGQILF
jgi:hypothetical protein